MRRWMIVLMVASLFVAFAAAPGSADKKELPEEVHFTSGYVAYGAVEAWTGDYAGDVKKPFMKGDWDQLMDPNFNRCLIVGATLTWVDKNTAVLMTDEDCRARGPLPPRPAPDGLVHHHKIVHITNGGAVKMTPGPDSETWKIVPEVTGCGVNGTFPVYHGRFDGEHLYATSHYHGPCDGGSVWTNFGIGLEDGPIHVTYEFSLHVGD
ncbi:MAG: hypothetical protein QNJ81_15320 [Acidimicrobiia bacterium]|nr:hypothetical protein [Acidimicrobiia bacterium]